MAFSGIVAAEFDGVISKASELGRVPIRLFTRLIKPLSGVARHQSRHQALRGMIVFSNTICRLKSQNEKISLRG